MPITVFSPTLTNAVMHVEETLSEHKGMSGLERDAEYFLGAAVPSTFYLINYFFRLSELFPLHCFPFLSYTPRAIHTGMMGQSDA